MALPDAIGNLPQFSFMEFRQIIGHFADLTRNSNVSRQ
jgi:hypothetical protein